MSTKTTEKSKGGGGEREREILARCKSDKVQLVRFLYCGNDSLIRGKACHTQFLNSYLRSGIGLTVAMQSFNMLDQLVAEGSFGPVGEIRLVPDPETFAVLPYAPKSARLLCDMLTLDGEQWGACPRSFLKRMIERVEALIAQGVYSEQYYAELGPGQQELPVRFTDALRAADNQFTVRDTA